MFMFVRKYDSMKGFAMFFMDYIEFALSSYNCSVFFTFSYFVNVVNKDHFGNFVNLEILNSKICTFI